MDRDAEIAALVSETVLVSGRAVVSATVLVSGTASESAAEAVSLGTSGG